jgi:hypothetical protein
MCRATTHWIAVLASCAAIIHHANAAGETVCNIPVSGTLLAGDSAAPYSQIRYAGIVDPSCNQNLNLN